MARRKTVNITKIAIVRVANRLFLERGFSNTSVKAIAQELGISTGHLTFYYPTKEHLLCVLVEKLCGFQRMMTEYWVEEGKTSIMAICLELVAMAAICEENAIAKDFYLSAYTNPMCLEIIRRSDAHRARAVFGEYCPGWTAEQYSEAETLVSGIEYATLMTTGDSASLETRIAGALNQIMALYNVPAEIRKTKIERVLRMDYRSLANRILQEFLDYIDQADEQLLEELLDA